MQQQSVALEQSRHTAEELSALAEHLQDDGRHRRAGRAVRRGRRATLATVQELSGAAGEILSATDEISRGAQMQAAFDAAIQRRDGGDPPLRGGDRPQLASVVEQTDEIMGRLRDGRAAVSQLAGGVAGGLAEARAVLADVEALEESGRRIEKIVDAIALVAVQTTMLAVSGSVEAARAGDQGQGFALSPPTSGASARNASENADQIKDLIQ